jgi:orotate phosphoribosyltransferase
MTDPQLLAALKDAALLTGNFTLRSGRKSRYYLDKYRFTTRPDLLKALAQRLAAHVTPEVQRIAGPELGGVPIATALSLQTGLPTVFIRNAKKTYGTSKQVEGILHPGDHVLITEDIATSGGQALEAATMLRDGMGCHVVKITAIIDREEGARETLENAGFAFAALFTKSDLGINE